MGLYMIIAVIVFALYIAHKVISKVLKLGILFVGILLLYFMLFKFI